jgi:hypothetical protein
MFTFTKVGPMNENETLREQMWDLCYGLLSAEERRSHKQIKSDPPRPAVKPGMRTG